jgi:iron complex outermembrane receptor protein
MNISFRRLLLMLGFILMSTSLIWAQSSQISGRITGPNGEPLIGANIIVVGTILGTTTDLDGNFSFTVKQDFPFVIRISMIGYQGQDIEITSENAADLQVSLSEQAIMGQEVVVSASRVEESILESPVTVEKMGILMVKNTPAESYYRGIASLKGVDYVTSSINFQIYNARGFNSTGNTRFVQLVDNMDTQAPALNFPIGSLNGPSDLDVESIEFLPGAASALYGPNAFNGILLINSKNPFDYQGLAQKLCHAIFSIDLVKAQSLL